MAENDRSFDRMQREAINRVREMQRRAQSYSEPPPPPDSREPMPAPKKPAAESFQGALVSLFKDIKIDEEKALIALLIYVLYKNGADTKLLLALGYLIL